jgi:hypothetical protein
MILGSSVTGDNVGEILKALAKQAPKAFDESLHQEALELEAASVPLVPVKEAVLVRSSNIRRIPGGWSLTYDTEYAFWVHEMPETNNFTKPGTGPKYLQRPFEFRMKNFFNRMKANFTKRLEI